MRTVRAGVLGATGAVGQRFVYLLSQNPWFEITAVAASERSVGKRYEDASVWRISADCPPAVRQMMVQPCEPPLECDIVFSALPSTTAHDVEERFAAAGYGVLSNASAHRMDEDVPLLIPEVNPDHLRLIDVQRRERGWDRGFIVTDPNCSTVGLTLALKPLYDAFGVRRVVVTTMQALSGAGYPGVAGLDSLDNVIPYIPGEEDKLVREPLKILGRYDEVTGRVMAAQILTSPSCNRVAVRDGHMESVSVELAAPATPVQIVDAFRSFRSIPHQMGCPSAVEPTIVVREEPDRPQPVLDRGSGHGMSVTIGRIRSCEVLDYKFIVLSHNTIRGAAGGSILNAEMMIAKGIV